MKVLAFLVFLIPYCLFAQSDVVGYWSVKCGGFGGSLQISSSNEVNINVNDNNLYISARPDYSSKEKVILYFNNIIESVNDEVKWGGISKEKPIAEAFLNDGMLYITWYGFYDAAKRKYIWIKQPDFVVASGGNRNIKMKRCNFN
ncbi:hypothetical protein ACSFCW_10260 [Yokenella regensburgei]|uniref:hypothetical protein n=1 Tax=Yokenella regensburgei TaxID=158877 RepID=UPI003EDA5773